MGHLWRRVGTGLWVVIAGMGVVVVALVGLTRMDLTRIDAQHQPGKDLLMAFAEFQPLHASRRALVVDVRDADSFANGHIPGAVHVPVRDVGTRVGTVKALAKGRMVVTYCSCPTEASSLRAAMQLSQAGMSAKALVGGFPRWVESGGAIER